MSASGNGGETSPTVLISDDGPVRVITLNRPGRKNAVDLTLRVELAEAVEAAMTDVSVRAIVLTGAGGAFCSGGDISTMKRQAPELTRPRSEAAQRVVRAIWNSAKPVVAAVEGPALGAGLALALACDRVVAASDAYFGAAFSAVGLAGDMGVLASLPARIGPAAAKQLLIMPRRVRADEALSIGLVDALADTGHALSAALADAHQLAAGPRLALSAIKSVLNRWPLNPFDVLDIEVEQQMALFDSDDFAEGVAAFAQHRPAVFNQDQGPKFNEEQGPASRIHPLTTGA